jgi:hypothetical protein
MRSSRMPGARTRSARTASSDRETMRARARKSWEAPNGGTTTT